LHQAVRRQVGRIKLSCLRFFELVFMIMSALIGLFNLDQNMKHPTQTTILQIIANMEILYFYLPQAAFFPIPAKLYVLYIKNNWLERCKILSC